MKKLGIVALLLSFSIPVAAEVLIADAGWELSIRMRKQNPQFHRVDHWMFPPNPVPKRSLPRAYVTLENPNAAAEHAVLLRYCVDARLRRIGTSADGVWTVPFLNDEKRVPVVGGGKKFDVALPLNRVALDGYLKKMYRAGFWPDAFRVRVMIEPRPGETLDRRVRETTLPVAWRPEPRATTPEEETDERSETAP
ncbi:MAG: hypothetical protein AUJ52_01595 [Elusimicrobia bacterium CG1_02_63_36]|nr:MAG: hypothetical protein AUJ52_01595 [Elusimicrobia bacterium CG1_02_63_36]PIP84804.1 MAG: hypothetical protein COR54_02050 [Elusimicrobia bacterium CG22_combo_CG10-13_8_21_14_all_63_91]